MSNEELLKHYGILGMKWGVRRTPEQLERARGKKEISADEKEKLNRKEAVSKRRTLSDADLKKKIERIKMEKELKSLTEEDIAPGKKIVSEILATAGKKTLAVAAAGAMSYAVKVAMTKEFNIKEAANYIAANPNRKK